MSFIDVCINGDLKEAKRLSIEIKTGLGIESIKPKGDKIELQFSGVSDT